MLTVSTLGRNLVPMTALAARRPARKRPDQYHHGDLRAALIQAALRTIQRDGVSALTLRGVGDDLGVSRTALYRHFVDKSALLAAVAGQGFTALRVALVEAWEKGGKGREGFAAMGEAYVRFAITNPSYYRVMFGGFLHGTSRDPVLEQEGAAAFQVLVDALVEQQRTRLVRADDPLQLARFIWAIVHGIAMLAIDGQLPPEKVDVDGLARYAIERVRTGIAATA
jgi:AcrR family transcriptional regulator